MLHLFSLLYNLLVIPALSVAQTLGVMVNKKIAERDRGVRQTWRTLESLRLRDGNALGAKANASVKPSASATTECFWFHAASMGEFEQAKPIIEALKDWKPAARVVVSFFSPSGFRHQHSYHHADAVVYLPLDSRRNTRRFLALVEPTVAVFVRYDLWWNFLDALKERGTPTFVVSATLNEYSLALRLNPARELVQQMYSGLSGIYTAGETETAKFQRLAPRSPLVTAADTRFDRIAALVMQAQEQRSLGIPQHWFADPVLLQNDIYEQVFTLVLGSSWKADEDVVFSAVGRLVQENYSIKLVIAPHEPSAERTRLIQNAVCSLIYPDDSTATPVVLSSMEKMGKVEKTDKTDKTGETSLLAESDWGNDIIVDSIGKLLRLYVYASAVFVGGGFGAGVHSVTEPAGYGVPLACGTRTERARDAIALQAQGALTVVTDAESCYQWLKTLLDDPAERARRGGIARQYVFGATGWSRKIALKLVEAIQD